MHTTNEHPRFCPQCGKEGLSRTSGAGFVEIGCWDGRSYCYEGDLPGYACVDPACGFVFSVSPTDEEVHGDCSCEDNDDCECGRYEKAHSDEFCSEHPGYKLAGQDCAMCAKGSRATCPT